MNSVKIPQATTLPRLIRVWPDWGQPNGMSRAQAYAAADKLPVGVRVKIGHRLRLNADRLAEYLQAGGDLGTRPE